MTDSSARLSIRSLSMWIVMAVTTTTLALSAAVSLFAQFGLHDEQVFDQLETTAKIMAANVAKDVSSGNNEAAQQRLSALNSATFISNAHIYWIDESGRQDFFTSYNQRGQSTVENKIGQLSSLYQGKHTQNVVELAVPVEFAGRKVGDLYVRAVFQDSGFLLSESLAIHGVIFLLMLLMAFLLSLKLHKALTRPIDQLSDLILHITRNKDYGQRAKPSSLKEVDNLANSVNAMLARIQDVLIRQKEAEDQHKKLNASLEQIVSQRTVALKEANQELIQTLEKLHQFQRQIVQNEKMASLGDMVAGVAHEVNTPIGLGVTASTMMLDRLNTIQEQFQTKTLKASTMARFIEEGQENLNIIYRNLNRAAELISSFKQVAVDQTSEVDRVVNMKQLLNEILLSLRPRLKKTKHVVDVICADELNVETKAGPINQIVINLIVNSLLHAFEDGEQGHITLKVEYAGEDTLRFVYTDNGMGIPNSIRKRIFDPFVTTKRGQGGSGLGMHLVYNLVTQALNGSISLTSEEGQGVEFIIVFPVKNQSLN